MMMLSPDVESKKVKKLFPFLSDNETQNIVNLLVHNQNLHDDLNKAVHNDKEAKVRVAMEFGLLDDPNMRQWEEDNTD